MHGLRRILREIHRRSLWQVLGIYLVGSWGVLQVVDYMTGFVGLPELNGPYRLRATLRLGPLYEQVGDTAHAVEAYRRVVDQWAGADARGMKAVDVARARIAALAPAGG